MKIWSCKVGEAQDVPTGADWPMRKAVQAAYRELTGQEPAFCFSGWGAQLTEGERAVVENREPTVFEPHAANLEIQRDEARAQLAAALEDKRKAEAERDEERDRRVRLTSDLVNADRRLAALAEDKRKLEAELETARGIASTHEWAQHAWRTVTAERDSLQARVTTLEAELDQSRALLEEYQSGRLVSAEPGAQAQALRDRANNAGARLTEAKELLRSALGQLERDHDNHGNDWADAAAANTADAIEAFLAARPGGEK